MKILDSSCRYRDERKLFSQDSNIGKKT